MNAYVAKLAEDKVDTGVTLATFDGHNGKLVFEIVRDRIIPSTWAKVTDADAQPRGMTPLNDAVGRIVAIANAGYYDKLAIIIMTDGHENASQELSVKDAKALLDKCRAKNWQVIFLGANFDNATQATSYGNAAAATAKTCRRRCARQRRVALPTPSQVRPCAIYDRAEGKIARQLIDERGRGGSRADGSAS